MYWIQILIAIPLFLVLFFSIGFILNMILKTTWLPGWLSLLMPVIGWLYLGRLTWLDLLMMAVGILGAWISGWVMRYLRTHGYQMF
ncbi:MAG: hypothetical protein IMX04_09745 [Candidatus Carbobacillus altaicus]|uniref:Uncharacterized protein n=1 Tax=Candidatus Carbonibacillus altaicus TaxID=2163959 RepID=A0A2R6Y4L0_9BACL|nr:hypothetical protein [Candidatus Carbobacillus altaicus]PTQ57626.1 MAG: hypothetical protein BSOLF_1170 [Candidatus Carbobacillus altaicus]